MCEICHSTPCNSRCPNAPEPPTVYECTGCGGNIVDGQDYYDCGGEPYCEDCVSNKTAEYEEPERDDYRDE